MRKEDYAYAVASIRQSQNTLLKSDVFSRLLDAKDFDEALKILNEIGYIKDLDSLSQKLSNKENETFEYLKSIAPHPHLLNFLVVKNDYHNIKAYLKSLVIKEDAKKYFLYPTTFNPLLLMDEGKRNLDLPKFATHALNEVYPILTKTLDGQIVDSYLDKLSIETYLELAKETDSEFCIDLSNTFAALINIKIAIRAQRTNKSREFLEIAIAKCDKIDDKKLIHYSLKGKDSLLNYIKSVGFNDALINLEKSNQNFEKWCDDLIIKKAKETNLISFGIEPLVGYFYMVQNEIKNLRIILSSINSKEDKLKIKERMRLLNV